VDAAIAAAILALVACVFLQVRDFGFVNFDDPSYVSDNVVVRAGLTWRGLSWAFTSFHTGNWHPLTWLSLMLDVQLFGVDPGAHHLVNVALHAANALLLFAVLAAATGSRWRSALVAALFAVHPLHVESVAWISERKDVLSTLFGFACVGAYARYARAPSPGRYAAVAAAFVLSLAAKPMLVTLPLVLLLLDRWPLRRRERWLALLREKVPLLLASTASCAVTLVAQRAGGAVATSASLPLPARLENALVSLGSYLWKAVWPAPLAVVYPHPAFTSAGLASSAVVLSAVAVVAISAFAAWQRRARPAIAVGWIWFLVTLLPVIGLVQVGVQAMADRYTYVPLVGPFLAIAWLLPDASTAGVRRIALGAGCAAAVLAAAVTAYVQTACWRDSFTLFRHALAVTRENYTALRNLGIAHLEQGEVQQGIAALRESLRILPGDAWGWMDLGIGLSAAGDDDGAGAAFGEAYRLRPEDETVLYNVGTFAATHGQLGLAREIHETLMRVSPDLARQLAEHGALR
jgi:tetratricopeptide (TPR) repeat protein